MSISHLRGAFPDLDQLTEAAPGWDVDFRRLSPGPFLGELRATGTAQCLVLDASFDGTVDQQGRPPEGAVTFAFGQSPGLDTLWRGQDPGSEPLIVFRPDREFDSVSGPNFAVRTVTVAAALLQRRADQLGLPPWEELMEDREVADTRSSALPRLRSATSAVLEGAGADPAGQAAEGLRVSLEEELPELLLRVLAGTAGGSILDDRSVPGGYQLVQRVRALLADRPDDPPRVTDLCDELGVSDRTLQNAFRQHSQTTPQAFIKAMRMNRVRRDLRALARGAGTRRRVSDIANRHGFWHMGQFARDYHRYFGELPSTTLGVSPRGVRAGTRKAVPPEG